MYAAADLHGQDPREIMLERAESRLRAIYERGEFQARRFRGEWLPDGSGYTVSEQDPESKRAVLVQYDAASGERTVLDSKQSTQPSNSENVSPDGRYALTWKKGNMFLRQFDNGEEIQLTKDVAEKAVSYGRAVWSPDGERIAYVRTDSSNVRLRSSLVPGDPSYPKVRETRFARIGGAIPKIQIGVREAKGAETRWLDVSKPGEDYYLGQLGWAGNSDELLVEKLSRFRDKREFLLANVNTGATACIFRESDPAWVVASYQKNAGLQWIRDGQAFVVLSEQDGWRHAYVYSRDGTQLALLTPGEFDIIERAKIDEARGVFYFYASPDNATQKYLFRVSLDGTEPPQRVTPASQPGTHDYDFSPNAKWAFHTYSTFDRPPVTELVRLPDHQVVRVLEDNQALHKKMKSLISQPTEFLQLDIGEDVSMDAWMIKPKAFDSSQKYPVLVYVYGEPHAQTVLDAWGTVHADYHRLIAELGYLVVSIDNRGTPAPKGAAWRRAVFGSLGPLSTDEQAAGVIELARSRPYVDLTRVAIWGWSGGGSNTLNAMFRKPEVYQAGIAVAPKPQPNLYNAWFQEIYMETPETNKDGYRRSAPINFAEGLEGDLMIIHGTGETNTHIQITEGLVDRLIELGKPFDYMAYPNRDHGLREGRGTAVHLRMLMVRYLLDHVRPGPQ
jgi:dipeptidyl-peptidase-4